MQEDLGLRQGASRYAGARPLADLQQNVLSGLAKDLQQPYSSHTGVTAKAIIPVAGANTCNLDPVQLRLKSIGLSQYAAVFAKEEIDEEALPCLSVQDLRSLGITNAAHQRLILSAAMQPATQTVARPVSTAHPAHLPATPVNVTVPSATHTSTSASSANSTGDLLPIRALPAGGLHSIAAAVASRQSKTAGAGTSALFKAARPSVQSAMGALSAAASQPRAAAAIAGAVAPGKGAGIIKGTSKLAGSTAKPAAAAPTVKAITSAAVTVNKAAGLPQSSKAKPGVKGVSKPAVAAFDSSKSAAVASMAGLATAPCAEPMVSKHKKATAATSGRAVEGQKGSSTLVAAAGKAAAVPAPRSKADEARQLAMALSASMGADADELVSTTEGLPSSAASQGVFMTMMAASKSKSIPTAKADPNPLVPPTQPFSRSQEEALLERVFTTSLAASSLPVIGLAYSSQRQPDSLSQAQAISVSESLWARAACSDPSECQLQDRVQKRKADAEMHRQMVKRQSLEQQHVATDAVLASSISNVAHQSQRPNAASADTFQTSTSSTPSGDTDCIIVTSPSIHVHDQTTARVSHSMGDEVCMPPSVDVQIMDPMKRMQWQALQQELKAARQTVADLERMIRTLEQT